MPPSRCSGDTSGAKDRFNTSARSTSTSRRCRRCARPTRRSLTVRRCTAMPAAARASSPSPASTRASASSTSSPLNNATTREVGDLRDLRPQPEVRADLRRDVLGPLGQGRSAHRDRPGPVGLGLEGHLTDGQAEVRAGGLPHLARRRRRRRWSRRDRRGHPGQHLRPGDLPRTARWGRRPGPALGTDDNAPYRVFHDVSDATAWPKGTLLEYRAVAKDSAGHVSASSSYGVVGEPKASGGGGGGSGPVTQPDAVSVPGDHNSEMGCPADWSPDCTQAQLTLDPKDQIWKGTYTLPAGAYAYKAAINRSWDENYGAGGGPGRRQHQLHRALRRAGELLLRPRRRTGSPPMRRARSSPPRAPSSPSSGCPADWSPDCMRPWLQDPDGDGTYTWSSDQMPAGTYEFKVAHGLSWDRTTAPAELRAGPTSPSPCPPTAWSSRSPTSCRRTWSRQGRQGRGRRPTSPSSARSGSGKDLHRLARGHGARRARTRRCSSGGWPGRRAVGWPSTPRTSPVARPRRCATTRTGCRRGAGRPSGAQGLPRPAARQEDGEAGAGDPQGPGGVGMYDTLSRLLDATGVQIAYVLDDLYAADAGKRAYGVTFGGRSPTYRRVGADRTEGGPADLGPGIAGRRAGQRGDPHAPDPVRTARGPARPASKNARYLYEVTVYVPEHGQGRDHPGDRPLLGRTDAGLDPVGGRGPEGHGIPAVAVADRRSRRRSGRTSTRRSTSSRCATSRSTTRRSAPRTAAPTSPSPRTATAPSTSRRSRRRGSTPCTCCRPSTSPRSRRTRRPAGTPACDLKSFAPDSDQQQACIDADPGQGRLQLGLRPVALDGARGLVRLDRRQGRRGSAGRGVPDHGGRASTRTACAWCSTRSSTTRPTSGQAPTSVLDKVVPGYYQRLNASGAVETSTCCQNVATEHAMAQKAMVDAVVLWARDYKVDGFRFDLMGHHSKANMLAVRAALDKLTLKQGRRRRQVGLPLRRGLELR